MKIRIFYHNYYFSSKVITCDFCRVNESVHCMQLRLHILYQLL